MSDWQNKSDPEINKAVTALQFKCDGWESNGFCFYNNEANGAHNAISINDYCNNVLASWPIIELMFNAGVTLMINDGGVTTSNLGEKYGGKSIDVNCKPLRAAMIVYLEMNGVKPNE